MCTCGKMRVTGRQRSEFKLPFVQMATGNREKERRQ